MATIRAKGRNRWEVLIRRKGFPPQYRTFDIKADAELWAAEVELEMRRGSFISRREAERTTIAEAFERYLREISSQKKGARQEGYRIRALLQDPIAKRMLADLRGADLARWRDARLKQYAPSSVLRDLSLISHLYTICRKEWGMEYLDNPAAAVRAPKFKNGRDRRLRPGEEEKLLSELQGDLKVMFVLALETAMRRSELNSLRWEWISGPVARLPDTKNGRSRAVPLSSRALAALADLPRKSAKVFSVSADYFTHGFGRACKRAGIEDLRLHDLRHEATSRLFEKGLGVMEVMAITGHMTPTMLSRYTHLQMQGLLAKLG